LSSPFELHYFWKFLATGIKEEGKENLAGPIATNKTCEDIDGPICVCFSNDKDFRPKGNWKLKLPGIEDL